MVLYLDCALLSGFVINYLCIDTTISIIGAKVKRLRIVFGTLVMSALSVFCLFNVHIKILFFLLYFFIIGLVMGKCSFFELLRRGVICIGVTLLYSAILIATIPWERMWILSSGGGTYFVPDDLYFYFPIGAIYIMVKIITFFMSKQKKIYSVRLQIQGQSAVANAMIDSGNSLRDTETGYPVIIAEKSLFGDIDTTPKIIRYKNIGSNSNFTKIYAAERVCLLEEHIVYKNIYVAFVDKPLSASGAYRVLLHNSFAERNNHHD